MSIWGSKSAGSWIFCHLWIPLVLTSLCHVLWLCHSFKGCALPSSFQGSGEGREAQWNSHQFSSATQSCPTLCNPMACSMLGFPVHHQLLELTQIHVHQVGDAIHPSIHLILCCPLLLLPSIFPSIKVFSDDPLIFLIIVLYHLPFAMTEGGI